MTCLDALKFWWEAWEMDKMYCLSAQWWHLALLSLLQKGGGKPSMVHAICWLWSLWVSACLHSWPDVKMWCMDVVAGHSAEACSERQIHLCGFWWLADFLEMWDTAQQKVWGGKYSLVLPTPIPLVGASFLKIRCLRTWHMGTRIIIVHYTPSPNSQRRLSHLCPQPE